MFWLHFSIVEWSEDVSSIFFTVYGLERDGPFSQNCGDGLTVISIVDPQKFLIFELFLFLHL